MRKFLFSALVALLVGTALTKHVLADGEDFTITSPNTGALLQVGEITFVEGHTTFSEEFSVRLYANDELVDTQPVQVKGAWGISFTPEKSGDYQLKAQLLNGEGQDTNSDGGAYGEATATITAYDPAKVVVSIVTRERTKQLTYDPGDQTFYLQARAPGAKKVRVEVENREAPIVVEVGNDFVATMRSTELLPGERPTPGNYTVILTPLGEDGQPCGEPVTETLAVPAAKTESPGSSPPPSVSSPPPSPASHCKVSLQLTSPPAPEKNRFPWGTACLAGALLLLGGILLGGPQALRHWWQGGHHLPAWSWYAIGAVLGAIGLGAAAWHWGIFG